MARLPRLAIAGHLHHVLQRGGHGQAICRDTEDYQALLEALLAASRQHKVAVHGYVLLADHFHLLLTPETDTALPLMMQALGRQYVRHFNQRYDRRGTLWEGRFKSTVLQDTHWLAAATFLDSHPLRTHGGPLAPEYPWSSHGHYTGAKADRLITPHPAYWALGNTPFAREAAYQSAVQEGLHPAQNGELTDAVTHGWALGSTEFVAELQKNTPRRLARKAAGRPISAEKKKEI